MALFAGIISAFVDNVATVLMIAPVALEICRKLKTNPVPFIIAVAVSSNLQGAATLVGDTTAIMLGSALDMSFIDFLWYKGKPSIFFAVELGATLSAIILFFLFRKEKAAIPKAETRTEVKAQATWPGAEAGLWSPADGGPRPSVLGGMESRPQPPV